MSWTWQEKHQAEGKLLSRSSTSPRSQRWAPWGAVAGRCWELGSLQGPCGDLSSWKLPSHWVQCPTASQRSSAQTSGSAAKPRRCLFCIIGFFFRVEIGCLLLILQVEREEKTDSAPLPAPLCLHPAPGDSAVTTVPRCSQLERCLRPGVSFGQVPMGGSPPL